MTDPMLGQLQNILENVVTELKNVAHTHQAQYQQTMGGLDDIAAHVLALQGVVAALAHKVGITPEDAVAWIDERTKGIDGGDAGAKARALAQLLVTGSLEATPKA